MDFFRNLFRQPPFSRQQKPEVDKLLEELVRIGKVDDYLSERPGGNFDRYSRHTRARQIGQRLHEIGGLDLMQWAVKQVRRRLGAQISSHLEYAWNEIGGWLP
jgi:hypothetical protein